MWAARRMVGAIVALAALFGLMYGLFLREPKYEADAVIAVPTSDHSSGTGGLLAAVGGVTFNADNSQYAKLLQILQSERLMDSLERKHGVIRKLFPGWNPQTNRWEEPGIKALQPIQHALRSMLGKPEWTPPNGNDLLGYFTKRFTVTEVSHSSAILSNDPKINAIGLELGDREQAIEILTYILQDADDIVRQDQMQTTAARIDYLTSNMDKTIQVDLRESMRSILVDQERALMTLKADRYYAFDLVDPPNADRFPSGPGALILAFLMGFVGFGMSAVVVFLIVRNRVAKALDPLAQPFPDPAAWVVRKVRRRQSRG
jgi:hypothetical protein